MSSSKNISYPAALRPIRLFAWAAVSALCLQPCFGQAAASSPPPPSAEAQLRIFRALAASADDVVKQLKCTYDQRKFLMYDPRILNDLLVLQGFRSQLNAYQRRYLWVKAQIDGMDGFPHPPDLAQPGDASYLAKTLADFNGIDRRFPLLPSGPPNVDSATSKSRANGKPIPQKNPFARPSNLTPDTTGGGGGGGGGQNPSPTGTPPFFPQSLSDIVSMVTGIPTALFASSTSGGGVAGPTTPESFIVGRIARQLKGTFMYPTFVPIDAQDPHNPLKVLFDLQLNAHDLAGKGQGIFRKMLGDYTGAIKTQFAAEGYWPAQTKLKKLFTDGYAFLKSAHPTVAQAQVLKGEVEAAMLDLANDTLLTAGQRQEAQQKLGFLGAALGAITNINAQALTPVLDDTIDLLKALVADALKFSYPTPAALTQLYTDVATTMSPLGGIPSSTQVQSILADLTQARAALVALSRSQFAQTIAVVDKMIVVLDVPLRALDPTVSLMQVVDGLVASLNTAAGGSTPAPATPAPASGAPAAPAAPTMTSFNPALPAAGIGTDTLATILVRGFAYRKMLDCGALILRVNVEMSSATDRIDTFGLNVPSRKSSAAAVLSYTIFSALGDIVASGSTLAYLPTALSSMPLSDKAWILRDEPAGQPVPPVK